MFHKKLELLSADFPKLLGVSLRRCSAAPYKYYRRERFASVNGTVNAALVAVKVQLLATWKGGGNSTANWGKSQSAEFSYTIMAMLLGLVVAALLLRRRT